MEGAEEGAEGRGDQGGRAFPDTLLVGHGCCPPKGAQRSELLFALLPAPGARGASSFSQRSGPRRQPALPRGAEGAGGGRTGRREGSARSSRRRRRSLARTRRARHRRPCRGPDRCERARGGPGAAAGVRGAAGRAGPSGPPPGRGWAAALPEASPGGGGGGGGMRRDATAWPSSRPGPEEAILPAVGSTSVTNSPAGAPGWATSLHSASATRACGVASLASTGASPRPHQEPGRATPGEHHAAGLGRCHPRQRPYGLSRLAAPSAGQLRLPHEMQLSSLTIPRPSRQSYG